MKSRGIPLFLASIVCCEALAREASASGTTATAVLQQTVATYQAMTTYRDHGWSVHTVKSFPTEESPATVVIDFVTLFKRPSKFRFSWTTTDNFVGGPYTSKDAIWSDGLRVWGVWSYNENVPAPEESFNMAVAAATGVSSGTAHDIFRLLSDKISGFRFDQLRDLKIVRSEMLQGVDCYVVRGNNHGEVDHELWIGKKDHLIRKGIHTTAADGNTSTFERTDIVVNQDIQDSEFSPQESAKK